MEQYPDSKNLPLIYNLVFYNGPKPFDSPRNIWDLIKNKDLAKKYLFKYQLIDTKDMLDEELRTKPYAGFMQFFMKYIYSKNMIEIWQKASKIFDFKKLKRSYLGSTLWYTMGKVDERDQDKLYKIITKAISTKEGENLMRSLADKWMEEGKATGEAIGIEKGKAAGEAIGIEKGKAAGEAIGIEKGKAAGIQENTEKIAVLMLIVGDSDERVARITGLSTDRIQQIKKSLKDLEN